MNPTEEDAYWSENYIKRDYVERHRPYTDYQSAYRYGWEARSRLGDRVFRDIEYDLARGWGKAKHATSDAWHRLQGAGPDEASQRD